jgi:hypothetical protein
MRCEVDIYDIKFRDSWNMGLFEAVTASRSERIEEAR